MSPPVSKLRELGCGDTGRSPTSGPRIAEPAPTATHLPTQPPCLEQPRHRGSWRSDWAQETRVPHRRPQTRSCARLAPTVHRRLGAPSRPGAPGGQAASCVASPCCRPTPWKATPHATFPHGASSKGHAAVRSLRRQKPARGGKPGRGGRLNSSLIPRALQPRGEAIPANRRCPMSTERH